jgi:hypothetical protein
VSAVWMLGESKARKNTCSRMIVERLINFVDESLQTYV